MRNGVYRLERFANTLSRFLTPTAAPDGLGSLRVFTPLQTARRCHSYNSIKVDESGQPLRNLPYFMKEVSQKASCCCVLYGSKLMVQQQHRFINLLEFVMNQLEFSKIMANAVTSKSFSGVVSIHQLDKVLYEKAFGFADHSNKLENRIDTRFGIASGTKFLTALAVGKLIEAKTLSFSTRLIDCVSHQFPNY